MTVDQAVPMSYKEKLQLFGVFNQDSQQYMSAEQYARQFVKCSVLKDVPVTYSANSAALNLQPKR